jgi:hypothetical protein
MYNVHACSTVQITYDIQYMYETQDPSCGSGLAPVPHHWLHIHYRYTVQGNDVAPAMAASCPTSEVFITAANISVGAEVRRSNIITGPDHYGDVAPAKPKFSSRQECIVGSEGEGLEPHLKSFSGAGAV